MRKPALARGCYVAFRYFGFAAQDTIPPATSPADNVALSSSRPTRELSVDVYTSGGLTGQGIGGFTLDG